MYDFMTILLYDQTFPETHIQENGVAALCRSMMTNTVLENFRLESVSHSPLFEYDLCFIC